MESTLNLTQEELKRKIFDIQKCKEEKKSLSDQLQMSFDKVISILVILQRWQLIFLYTFELAFSNDRS